MLELTLDQNLRRDALERDYARIRRGLLELCRLEASRCLDTSGVFDGDTATTFTDLWHFADPGHTLLAQALAIQLEPILASLKQRRRAPAGSTR